MKILRFVILHAPHKNLFSSPKYRSKQGHNPTLSHAPLPSKKNNLFCSLMYNKQRPPGLNFCTWSYSTQGQMFQHRLFSQVQRRPDCNSSHGYLPPSRSTLLHLPLVILHSPVVSPGSSNAAASGESAPWPTKSSRRTTIVECLKASR